MSEPIRVLLGPCPCQGCGQDVLYVKHGRRRGWLHATGNLVCPKPGPRPSLEVRPVTGYTREVGCSGAIVDTMIDGPRRARPPARGRPHLWEV